MRPDSFLSAFLFAGILLLSCGHVMSQDPTQRADPGYRLLLKKKKKRVRFVGQDYIGFTTAADTLVYFGDQELSYQFFRVTPDSLYLRRPLLYSDTTVLSDSRYRPPARAYVHGHTSFKKDKQWFRRLIAIDSFEYKTVPIASITSVQYPPDAANTNGCFFCGVLPVYNIFYWKALKKRVRPANFVIGPWLLESKYVTAAEAY